MTGAVRARQIAPMTKAISDANFPPNKMAQNVDSPSENYLFQTTLDGSSTLLNVALGETMHSTQGAWEETHLHYWLGCKMPQLFNSLASVGLLEVGLGMGLGLEQTLLLRSQLPLAAPLFYVSFEIDGQLVKWVAEKILGQKIIERKIFSDYEMWRGDQWQAIILIGDARQTLPAYLKSNPIFFHAIYQDAFSPRRNPELWTVEWFKLLASFAHSDCLLSTYSASSRMRKSLLQAGWGIEVGPGLGPRRQSTRAKLHSSTNPELELMLSSPKLLPFTDGELLGGTQQQSSL